MTKKELEKEILKLKEDFTLINHFLNINLLQLKKIRLKLKDIDIKKEEDNSIRRSGRTTRLADSYIQDLFKNGKIQVTDHYQESNSGDRHLFDIIMNRLSLEHPYLFYLENIAYSKSKLFIEIK